MRFRTYLLSEGRFDWQTTQIVRSIIKALKDNEDRFVKDKYIAFKSGKTSDFGVPKTVNLNLGDEFPNIFIVISAYRSIETVETSGSYVKSDNLVKIHAGLNLSKWPSILNNLIYSIKDTIRHELEHASQSPEIMGHAAGASRNIRYDNIQSILDYYTSPGEIEAKVAGLYKEAKTSKKPFWEIAKMHLEYIENMLLKHGYSREDSLKFIYKVGQGWLDYVKKRFPKAKL